MVGSEIRLNLGARDKAIPGFLSVDCDSHPGVDVVADVSNLSQFKDASVAEIYASHILEHFPHVKTAAVLGEWARVLCPGGILYVAVPDFERVVELYSIARVLSDWAQDYISGGQEYPTAYHYAIFDAARLRTLLTSAGFSEVSRVEYFPVGHASDCSRQVSNYDFKPVSLNLVAVK